MTTTRVNQVRQIRLVGRSQPQHVAPALWATTDTGVRSARTRHRRSPAPVRAQPFALRLRPS